MSLFTSETIINKGLSFLFNRSSLLNNSESGTVIISGKTGTITLPVAPES